MSVWYRLYTFRRTIPVKSISERPPDEQSPDW